MAYRAVIIGAAVGGVVGLTAGVLLRKPTAAPVVPPGPGPQPPVEPPVAHDCPRTGNTVAAIGDSFAEGLVPHLRALAKGCGTPYIGDGRSGTSVTQWQHESWIGPVLSQNPSVVLISLGGNDFFKDPATLQQAIDKLVDRIRLSGARAMWIEPHRLPMKEQSGVRQLWKDKVGADWFPSWDLPYKKAPDSIHLFPSGYQAWAREIWPWMSAKTYEMTA
jgi:lysophospholipase L1-like esterase